MLFKKKVFKNLQKKRADEHIRGLFVEQQTNLVSDISLAQRYTDIIRKLSTSLKVKLPREIKRSYCKHCYTVFSPSNSRTRIRGGTLVRFCSNCRKFTRIPFKK